METVHDRNTDGSSFARRLSLLGLAIAAAILTAAPGVAAASGPINTALPVVGGTLRDGSSVNVSNGKWQSPTTPTYTQQWMRCDTTGSECSNIAGATFHSYRLGHADVGHTMRAVVTATNGEGSASATSGQSKIVAMAPPVKAKPPVISGLPEDGQLLSSSTGTWKGTPPFTYEYQWQTCARVSLVLVCTSIPGATDSTYRATTPQIGKQLRVVVRVTNPLGSASNHSFATKKIIAGPPVNTQPPTVSGTPVDGQTLTASTGTWAGTGPFTYSYQWRSCSLLSGECTDVIGATGSTYTVGPLDVASAFEVVVSASSSHGVASATSPQTSVAGALLPGNTSLPSIIGSLLDGQLLSALTGGWSGTGPLSFAYQWQLCDSAGEACKDISGALDSALSLVSAEVGSTLRVVVTATNAAGSTSATSPATSLVAGLLPSNVSLPSITGSLLDGGLLSAVTGGWSGSSPISYTNQWQLCNSAGEACTDIEGALGSTLALVSADVGSTVRVVQTATNAAGSTSATSPATSLVGALLPSNIGLPSVTGSLLDGGLLSAVTGSWTGTGPITYSHQWQLCNSAGEACKDIKGALESTLSLLSADVGSTVRVVETATNAAGSTSATSPATGLIGALIPGNTSLPSVTGSLIDGQLLSALTGSWSGTAPIGYAYQWQSCNGKGEACSNISGATAGTLGLVSTLVGSTVRVVVTATNAAGSTSSTSAATGLIGALLPSSISLPSVTGSLLDGGLLSGVTGSWSGTGPISYSYAWEQCNSAGEACTEIAGAFGATLSLISGEVGSTIRMVVTATNAAGSTSATSAPTGLIGALLPGNTSLPGIVGSLIDGSSLTAGAGSWTGTGPIGYAYQWQSCNSKGEACGNISGATGGTLGLVSSLVGSTVRVIVTATNAGGTTQATSAATGLIGALIPGNTALPSIGGSLIDGQLLSAVTGSWTGTGPIGYAYQWQSCNSKGEACKNITEGGTSSTLQLLSGLVGSTVRVVVTATNAAGSTSSTSAATGLIGALIPGNSGLPSITGSLIDGQLLSAATGTWSGTAPVSYAYQWQSCNSKGEACGNISGATAGTLSLVSGLVGSTVRVIVTATNSAGSTSATSATSGLIGALLPGNTALPGIVGTLIDGSSLTSSTGSWSGTAPISYAYQWQSCNSKGEACGNIGGATAGTLSLVSGLVGSTVRVVVTATNAGGTTQATSAATGLIGALLPSNSGVPNITGTLIDGSILTSSTGTWSGTAPISYAYQWQQCNTAGTSCKNVTEGGTSSTLQLLSGLVGSTMRVVVTATNSGGSTQATSTATGLIGALLPANTSLPAITGTTEDGKTLTAATGSWSGTSPISYAYQWQQCNSSGEACKNITEGGVAGTLGLIPSLVKSTIRLVVTATNSAGSTHATSAPSGLVLAALPVNTVQPAISGLLKVAGELLAHHETWTGTAPLTYGYQWQLCGVLGLVTECNNIAGATKEKFILELLDAGLTLRVGVTAKNERGTSETAYSKVTGLISAL
jgi:uncharacterized protein YukE